MQERPRKDSQAERTQPRRSDFVDSLQKGLLIGLALLVVVLPPMWKHRVEREQAAQEARMAQAQQPRTAPAVPAPVPPAAAPDGARQQHGLPAVRLADFRDEVPSADARLVANWALTTGDHQKRSFVVVDKKDARVYVFSPDGKLKESAPVLLGAARGDDSFPGIGDKPLSQVRPEEKTTPAGRFVAEPGLNANNEDVVWVDYDAAVSMHRIRPLVARERRLERLATLSTDDNRISFGCINLPVTFYENVLSPTVRKTGAIVYVLPEVKTPQEVFGAFDVTDPIQLAAARQSEGAGAVQKVALTGARAQAR